MRVIIVEGVLFVALIAAGGALLYWLIIYFTSAGVRFRTADGRIRTPVPATRHSTKAAR